MLRGFWFVQWFLGKTTLLKILAGQHMVGGKNVVRVLNCSAFHDTQLVCSGDLAYLGGSWSKTAGSVVSHLFTFSFIHLFTFSFILFHLFYVYTVILHCLWPFSFKENGGNGVLTKVNVVVSGWRSFNCFAMIDLLFCWFFL